ncbi:YdcF family protein [Pseudonocardiaceae bacterium YIM PH 21723]|nr:YdcF family protein [Pseudonocardiaceae bacterium YIM PH 21723]
MRWIWGVATAAVAVLAWGEWQNRRWSRTLTHVGSGTSEAVVVLGYRNPRPPINFVNRWRVHAGLRSITSPSSRVIFTGGATGSAPAEARMMADYARSTLGFDGHVVIEDQSRTTWENVTNVIPLLDGIERIKFASEPAHALKARAYLIRQRPDLAERLVRSADYRLGERLVLKPLLALHGLRGLRGVNDEISGW